MFDTMRQQIVFLMMVDFISSGCIDRYYFYVITRANVVVSITTVSTTNSEEMFKKREIEKRYE
jgi:hypothetical protein